MPVRGSTLIEVLIAMAILALLMVGILQLFSVALVTDVGSAARTDMTMKAQQTAENLRYLHVLRSTSPTSPVLVAAGLDPGSLAISDGTQVDLPWAGTEGTWAYWGPAGANVMERPKGPYRVSFTYQNSATPGFWAVTVRVTSAEAAGSTSAFAYLGANAKAKTVDYVFQVHQ